MQIHIHRHQHTRDNAPFDESKHPRDGGKFASKPGASASNAEHSERARVDAEAVRRKGINTEKGKAHNEALGAWHEARKLLDPDKPMSEQSDAYKKAFARAEMLSTRAAQLRRVPEGQKQPQETPKDKKKPKAAPGHAARRAGAGNEVREAGAALKKLKRFEEQNDPDRKGGR